MNLFKYINFHKICCVFVTLFFIGDLNVVANTVFNIENLTQLLQSDSVSIRKRFPYIVSLQQGYGTGSHFCNGALVGRDTVLTALLCCQKDMFKFFDVYAVAGAIGVSYTKNSVYNRVLFCVKHPKTSNTFYHNIGLLRLEKSFVFSDTIKPIRMADQPAPIGAHMIAAGWGIFQMSLMSIKSISEMRYITMQLADNKLCESNSVLPEYNDTYVFCAYVITNVFRSETSLCVYDYGTPITYDHQLYGISFNNILCNSYSDTFEYNYFNKILYYHDWVNKVTPLEFRNQEIPIKILKDIGNVTRVSWFVLIYAVFVIRPLMKLLFC